MRTPSPHLPLLAALALAACESSSSSPSSPSSPSSTPSSSAAVVSPPASAAAVASSSATPLPSDDPAAAPVASAAEPAVSASAAAAKKPAADAGAKPPKDKTAAAAPSATPSAAPSAAASAAVASPAGPGDELARQVDAIFVGKKTFSSRFKQQYTQKISGNVKDSTGTVFVEKPNKISFRYDAPNKNRIVSDGVTLKVYVAEDSQMFETPVQKTQYPGALAFLMGNGISPSFAFTINDKAKFDGGPVLLGRPLQPNPSYEYVMFYVDKALLAKSDPGVMRRVLIVDAQGNKNRFDFENATQPPSIEPAEFTFTPPAGTNIAH
jgi:outer membrane lipoprotein-sorting protein